MVLMSCSLTSLSSAPVSSMWSPEKGTNWKERGKEEGREEGRKEGREEGREGREGGGERGR